MTNHETKPCAVAPGPVIPASATISQLVVASPRHRGIDQGPSFFPGPRPPCLAA